MNRREFVYRSFSAGLLCAAPFAAESAAQIRAPAPAGRLASAVESLRAQFPEVLRNPASFRLQACLSYPVPTGGWAHENYRLGAEWTAPASTVKLPIALLALHKLQRLGLDTRAQLRIINPAKCGAQYEETAQFESIARSLQRMLIVSDNGAFNRLYEFVGGDHVARELRALGFVRAHIQARLGACTPADNSQGRGFQLLDEKGILRLESVYQPAIRVYAVQPAPLVGNGYLDFSDQLVQAPKDFSKSNHWQLGYSHQLLQAIAGVHAHPMFSRLSPENQAFLRTTMATLPREAGFEEKDYPDAWGKFLVHGDSKERLPAGLRIANKIGEAYGFLTDTAWLDDAAHQCVLSATIYVNSDGILNDDKYEYDQVGLPFLAQLGRSVFKACPKT
jgi:beta-lactamase class A